MLDNRIKTLRKNLRMTQGQLAAVVGVHEMTVSKWERGILKPKPFQMSLLWYFEKAVEIVPDLYEEVTDCHSPIELMHRILWFAFPCPTDRNGKKKGGES